MLWVDKYHPRKLAHLDLHDTLTPRLQAIAESNEFPHLLFSGPPGAGKRTRVATLLAQVFGAENVPSKLHLEHKSVSVSESKSVDVTTLSSSYHMELNLADLGSNDRAVVMTIIKDMAQSVPLATGNTKTKNFKVLVLHEVDRISRPAQQALRRTMEKYVTTCRLILVAESTGRLIAPLRSRCLEIRVPSPSDEDIVRVLRTVLDREGEHVGSLTDELAGSILQASNGNLRRAVLLLEGAWRNDKVMKVPEWQLSLGDIALSICQEQTPKRLYELRQKYYDLLSCCIPPEVIMRGVSTELWPRLDGKAQVELAHWAAVYDHSMRIGSKPIFHLEAFTARAMSIYKTFATRVG